MNFSSKLIEDAVNAFASLPGIGKKTAELFGASCQSGITVAGGNQNQQIAARQSALSGLYGSLGSIAGAAAGNIEE